MRYMYALLHINMYEIHAIVYVYENQMYVCVYIWSIEIFMYVCMYHATGERRIDCQKGRGQ